jgi:hypothetical protein
VVTWQTVAGTGTTPTLNLYIQVSDNGSTWQDRIAFNQATTAALQQEASITSSGMLPVTYTDGTLASGSVRDGTFPGRMRVKYVVAGTSPVFNPVSARVICK